MRRLLIAVSCASLVPSGATALQRGDAPADTALVERSMFRLYKLQSPVNPSGGGETYEVHRVGDQLELRTTVSFNYLGTDVALEATLATGNDLTPTRLEIKGGTSTFTDVDASVDVAGASATVRERAASRQVQLPARFFTITHYPPVALEQALYRYWIRHGRPARLPILPAGDVVFERRGRDTVAAAGRTVALDRYSVQGLVWGRQSAWFDGDGNLVAVVHGDAELDRFEAVRDGFEGALSLFVRRAVADGIADLEALARRVPPMRTGTFAIVGAKLVDGTGAPPVDDAVVLVRDARIAAAGPRAAVQIPRGTPVVDARGKTVLPGLWDMHVHYEQVEWPAASLAAGVTTARDAANEFELIAALRDGTRSGRIIGPRLLAAGVIDGGDHSLGVITAATPEQARAAVRRYHDAKFEQIKIYQSLDPKLVPVVVEEAHRLGMTVTGHVPTGMDARQFVEAGADQINHLNFVTAIMRPTPEPGKPPQPLDLESGEATAAMRFLAERRVVLDPSLARSEEFLHQKGAYETVEPGVLRVPLELRGALQSTGVPAETAERARAALDRSLRVVAALHDAGVPIVLGTDLTVPGFSIYRELELAVRGGLTPMEAIQAATIVPARAMRLDGEAGTIEAGKWADLIVVDGDPLREIGEIRKVSAVVAAGRMYDSATLWKAIGFGGP